MWVNTLAVVSLCTEILLSNRNEQAIAMCHLTALHFIVCYFTEL